MEYNNKSHIKSVADVEQFFKYLVEERHIMFHPDDRFEIQEGISSEEASLWNRLLDESWNVCENGEADIYDICLPLALGAINGKINEPKKVGDCYMLKNVDHIEFTKVTDITSDGVVVADVISVKENLKESKIEYGKIVEDVYPVQKITEEEYNSVKVLYRMFLDNVKALTSKIDM